MINPNYEIISFVEQYFQAYFKDRDFEKVKSFLSPNFTGIGTGIHEFCSTTEESLHIYSKDLEEVKDPIEINELKIIVNYKSDSFYVVSGIFTISGIIEELPFLISDIRFSFSIIKNNGKFKIIHLHNSAPNNKQEDEEIYPLKKLVKQNKLLNEEVEKRNEELTQLNRYLTNSNNTKNRLLSIISHDLRSPFKALLSFIDDLKNKYYSYDDTRRLKYIDLLSNSLGNIYSLIDNLLIWSNIQRHNIRMEPEVLNIYKVAEESLLAYNELIKSKELKLKIAIDKSSTIKTDEFTLATILRNLVSNSIKFTKKHGSIIITADGDKKTNLVTISVIDTGVGMAEDQVAEIMNGEFFKSKKGTDDEKGTGLGLSVCDELLKLLGSKLMVKSKVGEGTTMYFHIKPN